MRLFKRFLSGTSAAVLALSTVMTMGFNGVVSAASGSDTCTWTGATDLAFSTASNWSGCSSAAPVNGDNLLFDATSLTSIATLNNDISNLSLGAITFQGANSNGDGFTLTGNGITLTNGVTMTGSLNEEIDMPLTISGDQTFALGSCFLTLGGALNGSGNITQTGTGLLTISSSPSYTGTLTPDATSVLALGNSGSTFQFGGNIVIAGGAVLQLINSASDAVFAVPLTVGGNGTALNSSSGHPGAIQLSGYNGYNNTLSSPITLTSNIQVTGTSGTLKVTGAISGAYTITPAAGEGVTVSTSSGTQQSGTVTTTIAASDIQPNTSVSVSANNVVVLDGTRSGVVVTNGGTLKGTGTANSLTVTQGGIVAPGHSPGKLTVVTTLNLGDGAIYQAELKDKADGDFDQIVVGAPTDTTGNDVTLGTTTGPTLAVSLYDGYKISKGDTFEIINNLSKTAVSGTFANLPEGATFTVSGYVFKISYVGGDGNDVVLTAQTVPATPDTGFAAISAHPLVTLGATALAAGLLVGLARKSRLAPARIKATRR